MKKPKPSVFFKYAAVSGLFFLTLFLAVNSAVRIIRRSDFFKIKYIIAKESNDGLESSIDLSYLQGRNTFALDLAQEARFISQFYPGYKKIRIVRILPDRLFADFLRRSPIAYVRLYRSFYVDEDAVLFEAAPGLEGLDLPVISGLQTKIFAPQPGRKYNARELSAAVDIIKETKNNKVLRGLRIKRIDVADSSDISFFLLAPENLQVKIGLDYIKDKVNILSSLLAQNKSDLGNIKYIDLRFKEPVIKFKDNVK